MVKKYSFFDDLGLSVSDDGFFLFVLIIVSFKLKGFKIDLRIGNFDGFFVNDYRVEDDF